MSEYTRLLSAELTDDRLPVIEPAIVGLPLGAVQRDVADRPQAYFGGESVAHLTPYDTATLRDGAIGVDMYTIDERDDVDYAVVTIKSKAFFRTATEKGIALRTGGGNPAALIERTPVQRFTSSRRFADIPIAGRAHWVALNPEGNISHGLYDDRDPVCDNMVAAFGGGWTFAWIIEGSRPFVFGELCDPPFIKASDDCPAGEAGIIELEDAGQRSQLPLGFRTVFNYFASGEQLRIRSDGQRG